MTTIFSATQCYNIVSKFAALSNIAKLCCAKNRCCESSRLTSPKPIKRVSNPSVVHTRGKQFSIVSLILLSLRKMRDFSWSHMLYLLCGILRSSSNCCDTGLSTITKLNSRCTVINTSTISRVIDDVLWSLCPTLSRILGLTSLPYARKPSTDTGKYMEITPMYAQKTDSGNLDALLMSV